MNLFRVLVVIISNKEIPTLPREHIEGIPDAPEHGAFKGGCQARLEFKFTFESSARCSLSRMPQSTAGNPTDAKKMKMRLLKFKLWKEKLFPVGINGYK